MVSNPRVNDPLWHAVFQALISVTYVPSDKVASMADAVCAKILGAGLKVAPKVMRGGHQANINNGVPKEGDLAFRQGWLDTACPHPPLTVDAMRWRSDWWRANADAFEDHVYSHEGDDLGRPA
jgi:hypothetical protein